MQVLCLDSHESFFLARRRQPMKTIIYNTWRVLMKYKHFFLFSFLVVFAFFGRGTPRVEAYSLTQATPIVTTDGTHYYFSGFSGTDYNPVGGAISWKFCSGVDYGTCASPITSNSAVGSPVFTFYTTHNFGYTLAGWPIETSTTATTGANTDGNYYFEIWNGTNYVGDSEYYLFTRTASVWNGVTYVSSSITAIAPSNGATNVDVAGIFTGTYTNGGHYQNILIDLFDTSQTPELNMSFVCVNGGGVDLPSSGSYSCNRSLHITQNFRYSVIMTDPTNFPVGNIDAMGGTDWTFATGSTYTVPDAPTVVTPTCTTLDIGCYLQNFSTWFFLGNGIFPDWGSLKLTDHVPFSYLSDMGTLYNDAFNHSASSFSLTIPFMGGTLPIISTSQLEAISFQPLIRTIMGALMMFGMAFFLYRKIIKIHDSGHQTTV